MLQDEWRITDQLTLNAGLRFDQMWQYVDANQLSPRVNLVYKPFAGTTLHAGYARYFTPPPQAIAGPVNIAAFDTDTYGAARYVRGRTRCSRNARIISTPAWCRRLCRGSRSAIDVYYKIATRSAR